MSSLRVRRPATATAAALLVAAAGALPLSARADALPPPEALDCPKGTVLVHNHNGTNCVALPPTNCPDGWVGIMGGKCVLDVCANGESCRAGLQCKAADLCATEGMGSTYGAVDATQRALLAAPPSPQWMTFYSDRCGDGKSCEGKGQCVASNVCLPAGAMRPAPRPASAAVTQRASGSSRLAAQVAAPDASAEPAATSTARPASSTPPPGPPPAPPPGRGGASCSASPQGALEGATALELVLGLGLVALVRRRVR